MRLISMAFVETASEEQAMAVKGWLENKFVSSILIPLNLTSVRLQRLPEQAGECTYTIWNI